MFAKIVVQRLRGIMRVTLTIIGIVLALGSFQFSAQAEELQFFRIGTGGVSGTYYPIGGIIAHAISNPPGDRPCEQGGSCGPPGLIVIAQSANGSVANVQDMQRGILESGFVQSDVAFWAYTGTGKFKGRRPVRELRSIANLYPESIHIVVRKSAGIKRIKELRGKRVSLDEHGSGTLIDAELVLNIYGLTLNDIDAEYMKPSLAVKRIKEDKLDAFFFVAGYPARAIFELASDSEIELLPIDGLEADLLVSGHRFFARDHIPASVYPGVPRIETISVGAQWLVSSTVEEAMVYDITRSLWNENSRRLLDSGHARGRDITLGSALRGISVPLHPGAARFYYEIGMATE